MEWLDNPAGTADLEALAQAQEDAAADLRAQIAQLTAEIKDCGAAGDFEAARRKERLRRLCRRDMGQLRRNAADLRAGLADKAPVGSHGAWRGATRMEKW